MDSNLIILVKLNVISQSNMAKLVLKSDLHETPLEALGKHLEYQMLAGLVNFHRGN